jgi:hypothetical protein
MPIIDFGNVGYTEVGTWGSYSLGGSSGQFGSNYRYSASGTGADEATWTFTGLSAGTYDVSASWAVNGAHATAALYRIYVNGVLVDQKYISQTFGAVADYTVGSVPFEKINQSGAVSISAGDTLSVKLDDSSSGTTVADAISVDSVTVTPPPVSGATIHPLNGGAPFHPLGN